MVMAKFRFCPLCWEVMIPMSCPRALIRGLPELPPLIGAVVWMTEGRYEASVEVERSSPLTIPASEAMQFGRAVK